MRYSNYYGILAGVIMIIAAAFPWIYIPSIDVNVSGFGSTAVTKFGKPVLLNVFLFAVNVVLFLIPKFWAKRINPFVGAIGFAWALRNVILLGMCRSGECPDRLTNLWIYFIASFVLLVMTLLPDLKVKNDSKPSSKDQATEDNTGSGSDSFSSSD